jgi:hypothetical protein
MLFFIPSQQADETQDVSRESWLIYREEIKKFQIYSLLVEALAFKNCEISYINLFPHTVSKQEANEKADLDLEELRASSESRGISEQKGREIIELSRLGVGFRKIGKTVGISKDRAYRFHGTYMEHKSHPMHATELGAYPC